MNICDPNDPNYLECVARNYGGRDDYEQFAPKGYSSEGIGGFNFGDMFSSFSQPQGASMFNPFGFSNQTRLAGLAFGPVGILGSLAVEKYRAGQEAKAAAEAKAAEAARAKQEQINRNKQYFSGGDGGGRGNIGSDGADYSGSAQTGAKGGFGY